MTKTGFVSKQPNLAISITLLFIRCYRVFLSTLLGPACRFYPSCSHYAEEAFSRRGFFKGLFLSTKRILKCHPFHPGGIDELPSA